MDNLTQIVYQNLISKHCMLDANCTPKEPLLASCPTSHTNSTIYFQDEIVTIALETIDILTFRIVKLNVLRTLL